MSPLARYTGTGLSHARNQLFPPIEQYFDRFFEDFFSTTNLDRVKSQAGYPKLNISQNGDNWTIKAAVPGVQPDELKVEVVGDMLRISGQMSEEYRSPDNSEYYLRELHQSRFSRELVLPDDVAGDPTAEVKDGILTLTWKRKQPESAKVKTIPIKGQEKE